MNTWPNGQRKAIHQSEHEDWNRKLFDESQKSQVMNPYCPRCKEVYTKNKINHTVRTKDELIDSYMRRDTALCDLAEELEKELTAAKAEVEKLKQINDTQARELIERGKDIDTLKTAMHQSPTKLCHIDRDRAEQQRCKRCEAYLSNKRPAGRTLCEDCMRLPEHTYIPPVIIPPAKPHDIGWPLPAPPWGNISTTPLRDQNTP